MKQENQTTHEVTENVDESRRDALNKLKYAPPVIATLLATDSAWAQTSGGGEVAPPPAPPPFPGP